MDNRFWCITVMFNPAGYRSRLDNYHIFAERLAHQNINLLTVELAFNNQLHNLTANDRVLQLRSNSVMWQKERLINYAISQLPSQCNYIAWLDSDLMLPDGWDDMVVRKLETTDFVQLFERIIHLQPGDKSFGGEKLTIKEGIIWQNKLYKDNWIKLRLSRELNHAEPGFGWASKRKAIANGLYDRLIIGSGDNWLVDCLLDSTILHHYLLKITSHMNKDMEEWKLNFNLNTNKSVDYLPIEIYHLWHGSVKNRNYLTRDLVFKQYDFDPKKDIMLKNNVWEWTTNKFGLHESIKNYFLNRKEDGDVNP